MIVKENEILEVARCTAEIFRDFGSREVKAKARFRWLVDAWGTEKLKKAIEEKMGKLLEVYSLAHPPTSEGEHAGVQHQKQKGYSYINIPVISGILSSEKMRQIAHLAEKYGKNDLRLTPFQNIIIANVHDEDIGGVLKGIEEAGFCVTSSYLKWATVACAGRFCGKTLDDPKKRAVEALNYLDKRFGDKLNEVKLRVSFSGCPNGCARHLIADIGLQGTAVATEGKNVPAYNLYQRTTIRSKATLGTLIKRGIKSEDAKLAIADLIEAYLKNQTTTNKSKL